MEAATGNSGSDREIQHTAGKGITKPVEVLGVVVRSIATRRDRGFRGRS